MTRPFFRVRLFFSRNQRVSGIGRLKEGSCFEPVEPHSRLSTPHRLPVEIEQHIASFLNSHDLTQLSLADKSWKESAELSLYRHIQSTYALYHSTNNPVDERSIRLLWNVAQIPRHATHVRTLNAAAITGSWVWNPSYACMFCEFRRTDCTDQVRHCAVFYEPVPENILDPNRARTDQTDRGQQYHAPPLPNNEGERRRMIYAIAGRRIETCRRADQANRLVYWANFYLALEACVNATAVLFPSASSATPLDTACLELLTGRDATQAAHIAFLQLPYSLVDTRNRWKNEWNNPQAYSPPLPLLAFINKAVNTFRILTLEQNATDIGAGALAFLADHGVSVVLSAVESEFSRVEALPVLYGVPSKKARKSVARYFDDVHDYVRWMDSNHRHPDVQVTYHVSQKDIVLSTLPQTFGPVPSKVKTITLGVASQRLAQEAGWPASIPAPWPM